MQNFNSIGALASKILIFKFILICKFQNVPCTLGFLFLLLLCMMVYFVVPIICNHCSCFSDDRFQPDKAIFKSDGSEFLCTYYARDGQVL